MSGASLDLVLRQARIVGGDRNPVDIGIRDNRIVVIEPQISTEAPEEELEGRLVLPGFVESHVHLDKSCLTDRCGHVGSLTEAIAAVAAAKREFTVEDIYARGRKTMEKAILQGTTAMRTHVEVDPRVGLRGFEAVCQLKRDFSWALDLQVCVFPQEGLLNDKGTEALLIEALEGGADLVGGCPYTDSDPHGQIARIFDLARVYDVDIDFHLDFHLDPPRMDLGEVCRLTEAYGWGDRVAVGHVTGLSAVTREGLAQWAARMATAGVALTVLPATDLFLMGRECECLSPRGVAPAHLLAHKGVTCSIATNNVLNPFTPFGDCSLLRMANLYANVAQIDDPDIVANCFDMVTSEPARLMNLADYGIAVGNSADIVALDAQEKVSALAEIAQPLFGIKHGRYTFVRPAGKLVSPATQAAASREVR